MIKLALVGAGNAGGHS